MATGNVGTTNFRDTYTFNLHAATNIAIRLSGLQADADVSLFRASAINQEPEPTELINRSINAGTRDDLISQALAPGSYIVQVDYARLTGNTPYRLNVTSDAAENEFNVGLLNGAQAFAGVINSTNDVDRRWWTIRNSTWVAQGDSRHRQL
jgi:Bacterial pre-peptidase C-terminal domain